MGKYWRVLKSAYAGYMADNSLSRGAAIAYYTVFSIAPVLVIVIAIAGLVFGADAARGAIVDQISGLVGQQSAEAVQAMIQSASNRKSGIWATVIGLVTLIITASGVFGEMQAALNTVWKAEPKSSAVGALVRARLVSLGVVMALGFLLLVSLVVSAGLKAADTWLGGMLPFSHVLLQALSFAISFLLISVLFAVIYKVLPDEKIDWRDVAVGAVATSLLFSMGKFLISLYIGSSSVASSYGAAGALAVLLVWIYYSSQIFLFGAQFTRGYAEVRGSPPGLVVAERNRRLAAAKEAAKQVEITDVHEAAAARAAAQPAVPHPGSVPHREELAGLQSELDATTR